MPPNLDIYVICRARDRETIERFPSAYADRAASEDPFVSQGLPGLEASGIDQNGYAPFPR